MYIIKTKYLPNTNKKNYKIYIYIIYKFNLYAFQLKNVVKHFILYIKLKNLLN